MTTVTLLTYEKLQLLPKALEYQNQCYKLKTLLLKLPSNRLPYENPENEDVSIKKIKLIQEVATGMSKFEATYSYLNGILNLELADTILQKLNQMFSGKSNMLKNFDPMQFVDQAKQSVKGILL